MTPLGVLIKPQDQIQLPPPIKAALPKDAIVRMFQKSSRSDQGESFVVYSTPDEDDPEIATDPHVVVFTGGTQVSEIRVAHIFVQAGNNEDDDTAWEFFSASYVPVPGFGPAFMLTFRNIGDGAATRFVLIAHDTDGYHVIWQANTTQGQFRLLKAGRFQLWSSNHDGACVWCSQTYQVTNYIWRDKAAVRLSQHNTRAEFSPSVVADNPILVGK
jgi:hypothetical protein